MTAIKRFENFEERSYPMHIKVKNCLKNIKEKYLKHLKGDINNEL